MTKRQLVPLRLIFTDVMMPGVTDGFALAKWMSENQPDIPVIVTSGDGEKITNAGPRRWL